MCSEKNLQPITTERTCCCLSQCWWCKPLVLCIIIFFQNYSFFRRVSCSVLHYGDTGWNTNVSDGGIYWSVHVSRRDQSMEHQSSLHGWAALMSYVFLYLSTTLNPTASTWQQSQKKHCHLVAPALSFQFWEAQKRLSYKMKINTHIYWSDLVVISHFCTDLNIDKFSLFYQFIHMGYHWQVWK